MADITLNIDGDKLEIDIDDLFRINEDDLTSEFAKQASLYARFGVLAAKAEWGSSKSSAAKDQEYALADLHYRDSMEEEGKKYTEGLIRSLVLSDEVYSIAIEADNQANYAYRVMRAISSALEQRANMLISLGAFVRQEMSQTDMNIRHKKYDDAIEETKKRLRK